MAGEGKNRRPESANFRIWPGVTLIAVCAFLLFFAVYAVAYRIHLIPLPDYLESILGGEAVQAESGETEGIAALMPEQETENGIYFDPSEEDPYAIWQTLQTPEQYRQRMRITRSRSGRRESFTADVYVQEEFWKLICYEEDTSALYVCDGTDLYRENSLIPEGETVPAGGYTPANLLGIPNLADLQQTEADVQFSAASKMLRAAYVLENGTECVCQIALDTGLLMEMQMLQNGETILIMYTELFDLAPEELAQKNFFTIPKTEE
ncbi:MAG: hypothetical protein IJX14_03340 [Clostridia bacterium]|nr:hypothetical protein [Clostridia bacterium]